MGTTVHYHAKANQDKQIEDVIYFFNRYQHQHPTVVDFPFDRKWLKRGFTQQPDYPENWEKYYLCSGGNIKRKDYNGELPDHYMGIILEPDVGCEPLWFTFGRYPDLNPQWNCDEFTKTQFARDGFLTHVDVISKLEELEPLVDYLEVNDEAELWKRGDLEHSARIFGETGQGIRKLGELLTELGKEYGVSVKTGWEEE